MYSGTNQPPGVSPTFQDIRARFITKEVSVKRADRSMKNSEFEGLIKQNFDYLFERFGFEVTYKGEASSAHDLVVLGSAKCQLKFISEFGTVEVLVGPNDAKPGWDNGRSSTANWYALWKVIDFVLGRPNRSMAELEELHGLLWGKSTEAAVKFYADLLRSVCDAVCELFQGEESQAKRRALTAYFSPASST